MSKKHIQWLRDELPELTRQEIISKESALKLQQHYEMDELASKQSLSLFTIILATIGGLLIGGGIILIFAYNWDNINRPMRTVIAFATLLIAQALCVMALYPKQRGPAWREVAGILLFCAVAAAISIIGQTYHISGDYQGFMTYWFLLLLPVVYLLKPHLMTMLMIILASANSLQFDSFYWLGLFALLPYYILVSKSVNTLKSTQTSWLWVLCCAVVIPANFLFRSHGLSNTIEVLTLLSFAVGLYLTGSLINTHARLIHRPFMIIGALIIAPLMIGLSHQEPLSGIDSLQSVFFLDRLFNAELHDAVLFTLINTISVGLILYKVFKRQFADLVLPSVLILLFAYTLILPVENEQHSLFTVYGAIAFSITAFAIGCWYLFIGVKNDRASQLNFGLLIIMSLLMVKFFNDDFSILSRGIVFIVLGSALISVNIWHSRRGKA